MRIGLIGYGAIAADIVHYLDHKSIEIVSALVMEDDLTKETPFPLTTSFSEFMDTGLDLVVECAGHRAVDDYGVAVLSAGIDIIIVSIGAFADEALFLRLKDAAGFGRGRMLLPAGALIGVDGLAAARKSGLTSVTIRSVKPPMAWAGAEGVRGVDLASIKKPTVVFSGSAREAARAFPKNANVAATTALAGVGFDKTKVELIADPATERNTHTLIFEGSAGSYELTIAGNPSPINPKTSQLTALSIVRLIENRVSAVVL